MLLVDSQGVERARLEGYLPNDDFNTALRNGLGRIAFVRKQFANAEKWYGDVIIGPENTHYAAEAMYWRAVAHYKATNDHSALVTAAEQLRNIYPASIWASKAIPWLR